MFTAALEEMIVAKHDDGKMRMDRNDSGFDYT